MRFCQEKKLLMSKLWQKNVKIYNKRCYFNSPSLSGSYEISTLKRSTYDTITAAARAVNYHYHFFFLKNRQHILSSFFNLIRNYRLYKPKSLYIFEGGLSTYNYVWVIMPFRLYLTGFSLLKIHLRSTYKRRQSYQVTCAVQKQ